MSEEVTEDPFPSPGLLPDLEDRHNNALTRVTQPTQPQDPSGRQAQLETQQTPTRQTPGKLSDNKRQLADIRRQKQALDRLEAQAQQRVYLERRAAKQPITTDVLYANGQQSSASASYTEVTLSSGDSGESRKRKQPVQAEALNTGHNAKRAKLDKQRQLRAGYSTRHEDDPATTEAKRIKRAHSQARKGLIRESPPSIATESSPPSTTTDTGRLD